MHGPPRRSPLLLLLVLLLAPGLGAQLKAKSFPVSTEVAQEAKKEFAIRYRSTDDKLRLAAVDALVSKRHPLIADCLARALEDSSPMVRATAAAGLGVQDPKQAVNPLRRALLHQRNADSPEVLIGVLEAFQRLQRAPPLTDVSKVFDRLTPEAQREVIKTLRYERKMATIEFLVKYLDDPRPDNVDSPSNPPAAYWKARLEQWRFWVADLQETLHDLTGQEFDRSQQVKDWRRKGGKIVPPKKTDKDG